MTSLIYYGLSLSTASLSGDPYLSFLLSALVEIPGYTLSYLSMEKLGRRPSLVISLVLGGISVIVSNVASSIGWLNLTFFLVGKLGATCAFGTIYLYTSELYPTSLRTKGVGFSSMCSRISTILAPHINHLSNTAAWLPMAIFGTCGIVSGLLCLLLPETLGREMPQTIADALAMGETSASQDLQVLVNADQLEQQGQEESSRTNQTVSSRTRRRRGSGEAGESTPLLGCI